MSLISSFFFFKQKTAYEMRISDWSSDVCSSDLCECPQAIAAYDHALQLDPANADAKANRQAVEDWLRQQQKQQQPSDQKEHEGHDGDKNQSSPGEQGKSGKQDAKDQSSAKDDAQPSDQRSEEHTSELQSLMRISYAVFCLKKKKT